MLSTTLHSILGRSRGRRWRLCRGGRKPRRVGQIPLARARKAIEAVRRRRTVIVWHWKKGKKEGGKTGGGGAAPPQILRSVQSAQTDDRHWKCSGKTGGRMEILDIVDSGRHCFATARLCEQNLSSIFQPQCNQFPQQVLIGLQNRGGYENEETLQTYLTGCIMRI